MCKILSSNWGTLVIKGIDHFIGCDRASVFLFDKVICQAFEENRFLDHNFIRNKYEWIIRRIKSFYYRKIFKLLIDNIVGNQGPTWNGGR